MSTVAAMPTVVLHPLCSVVRLRAMRKALWMRRQWAAVAEPPHPQAIQDEEVDQILSDPGRTAAEETRFYAVDADAQRLGADIAAAERELRAEARWNRLIDTVGLSAPEQHLLAITIALALDPSLGRVFAYLHDQADMPYATSWLAGSLFDSVEAQPRISANSPLLSWRLLRPSEQTGSWPEAWRGWLPDSPVVGWLTGDDANALHPGMSVLTPDRFLPLPVLFLDQLQIITEFCALGEIAASGKLEFELLGPAGSGRRTLAGQYAARRNRALLCVDAPALLAGAAETEIPDRVVAALRTARLDDLVLFWNEGSGGHPAARTTLSEFRGTRIVARTSPVADPVPGDGLFRSIELPALSRTGRAELWGALTTELAPPQIRDWMLTPGEIARVVQAGAGGADAVLQACRRPTESLDLLLRLPLPYRADDLILATPVGEQLDDFERQIRARWDVYEDWGFERLCPNGRGIVALFSGPSGTGKTMAAQVLARNLGMELYRLDPAQVVNKYIGETEKRLKSVFDECDRAHFLLLIDECEGMFGQRFSSKDAHDRYANLEIDYLLQRLERFQGVAVLATNRKSDLDSAFLRRLRFVIDFMPPEPPERRKLWESAIPEKAPDGRVLRGAINWDLLAHKAALTGAEIKLAALNAAFLAYAEGEPIGMPQIVTAVRREFAKKGQTLRGWE